MEPLHGDSAPDISRRPTSPARRRTALIVDDCETLHAMVRDVLAPEFDCESAGNAEEAIAIASRRTPDVIISDVQMPTVTKPFDFSELEAVIRRVAAPAARDEPRASA